MFEKHHYHKCPKTDCGKIWHHGPECAGSDAAHTCPACGNLSWGCFGKITPTYEQAADATEHTGGVS